MSNEEKFNENDLLPDIESFLEQLNSQKPVSIQNLDQIIDEVTARTALNREAAGVVVQLFFQEIRNALLKNEEIRIKGLGRFLIASPKNGNKIRVFPKFKPAPTLVRKLNGKY